MEKPIEKFYQIRAKEIIDLFFEKKYFREDVNRNDMQTIEDFLAWSFQSQCESAVKCAILEKQARTKAKQIPTGNGGCLLK